MKFIRFAAYGGILYAACTGIFILACVTGCGEKDKSVDLWPPKGTTFVGYVSLNVVDSEGRPFPGIPVVMELHNTEDPMTVPYDTVYTNIYGVAFLDEKVMSFRNSTTGRLTMEIDGETDALEKRFINGEQFYLIYRIYRSSAGK